MTETAIPRPPQTAPLPLRLLSSIRFDEVIVLQGAPLIGALAAMGAITGYNILSGVVLALGSACLVAHVYSFNDWSGIHGDLRDPNRAARTFVTRGVSRTAFGWLSAGLLIASLLLLALLGPATLALAIALVASSMLYSAPAVHGKGRPILSSLLHLAGGTLQTALQDVARARGQYELFRSQRLEALGRVLEAERQLRKFLGMPATDCFRLIPSDTPTVAPYQPDWCAAKEEAFNLRPELQIVRDNIIEDSPHMAVYFDGNDHLIEGNRISRMCAEVDDAGAIYAGRDWTYRGNVIRGNVITDISRGDPRENLSAIYLDDMLSGVTVEQNVIVNARLAARLWPDADPIGRRLVIGGTLGADQAPREIVGVAGDVRSTLETGPADQVYLPQAQNPWPTENRTSQGTASCPCGPLQARRRGTGPGAPERGSRSAWPARSRSEMRCLSRSTVPGLRRASRPR